MEVVTTIPELNAVRANIPKPVGLVPTMGYLHNGHLSLVQRARKECASVVASIFVNPTQFGPNEDLEAYPRDLPRDLNLLEAEGVDVVWTPTPELLYPPGYQTWVIVEEVAKPLEGFYRPGHFRGVTTIVNKLFNSVQPQKAYFGQKDAQQAVVISRMVIDLDLPIKIIVCPTVREPDGLAKSSRNVYLNASERRAAPVIYRSLTAAGRAYENGTRNASDLREIMTKVIGEEPLAQLQYLSCADPENLHELQGEFDRALLSMAVFLGKTRLIDNILIGD